MINTVFSTVLFCYLAIEEQIKSNMVKAHVQECWGPLLHSNELNRKETCLYF